MAIETFYDQVVEIKRMSDDESGYGKELETWIGAYPCHIQPLDSEITRDISVGYGKEWLCVGPLEDIQEGDRVFWNGTEYRITGIEKYEMGTVDDHSEIRIRAFQS